MMARTIVGAAAAGWEQGFQRGWEHGIRMGGCQAIMNRIPAETWTMRDVKVLFIPQGFEALDEGVIHAMQGMVREFHVAAAAEMVERANQLRPDFVLVLNGLHVFPEDHAAHVEQIRSMGIKTAIWFADDPYFSDFTASLATHYDYIFTHELSCVPYYRELGNHQTYYLPLAVNTNIYKPMHVDISYQSDVCFIGNAFPNRIELFNRLVPFLADKKVMIAGALWEKLDRYALLKDRIRLQWIPIKESVKYYNGAKIVINVHRLTFDPDFNKNSRNLPAYSINPRTFEISACGTLQLTDIRHDLHDYYTPGHDIETFASPQECISKMQHYLTHEEERRGIALRGLRRTFTEHMFGKRLEQLLQIVFP
ncbi:CgeB family protein [Paenibacillus alkaliterrae]|uniref:CgeB family protein n=2 Tax=Paenibacillus alkaliterrae TaxID=320909 RepID=UPI001F2AA7BC|nr:glycosyltransferase [Paenibacillus alkaliterrae]